MKKIATLAILFVVAASFSAQAQNLVGNIVRVLPEYSERQIPQQICETDLRSSNVSSVGAVNPGTVIGGIAGALLGSQAGGGNGRVALTALGAVTGAMTGDRLAQSHAQPQQVCRSSYRTERQVISYRVMYEVDGKHYLLNMPFDPSEGGAIKTIPVRMVPTISQL
jgi:uncharacterized protein YcfJ